jgi:hypothetical protein
MLYIILAFAWSILSMNTQFSSIIKLKGTNTLCFSYLEPSKSKAWQLKTQNGQAILERKDVGKEVGRSIGQSAKDLLVCKK